MLKFKRLCAGFFACTIFFQVLSLAPLSAYAQSTMLDTNLQETQTSSGSDDVKQPTTASGSDDVKQPTTAPNADEVHPANSSQTSVQISENYEKHETFETIPQTSDVKIFTGSTGVEWTLGAGTGYDPNQFFSIFDATAGKSVKVESTLNPSYLNSGTITSETISGGLSEISVQAHQGKWVAGQLRSVSIYVNGQKLATQTHTGSSTGMKADDLFTLTWTAQTPADEFYGDVQIQIVNDSPQVPVDSSSSHKGKYPAIMVDNLKWSGSSTSETMVQITGIAGTGETLTANIINAGSETIAYSWFTQNSDSTRDVLGTESSLLVDASMIGKQIYLAVTISGTEYVSQPTLEVVGKPIELSVTFEDLTREYDRTNSAELTYTLTGVEEGDDVALDFVATFDDKNVETNKTISINDVTLIGENSNKYSLASYNNTVNGTITAKEVLISDVVGIDKVYNKNADALVRISLVGAIDGDDLATTYSATFDNANIGNNKTIAVQNIVLSGSDAKNYTLSQTTATARASISSLREQNLYEIGDSGVAFDMSKYDDNYPYMLDWMTAGVVGGIPQDDSWAKKIITMNSAVSTRPNAIPHRSINVANKSNQNALGVQAATALQDAPKTSDIQRKLDEVAAVGGGVVILENGYYFIDEPLYVPSNVVLRGREEGKVTLFVGSNEALHANVGAITFVTLDLDGNRVGSSNSGVENIILEGVLGKPNEDWNVTAATELDTDSNFVLFDSSTENCWIDDVSVINSYQMPVNVAGKQNTLRNVYINGAFCRGGGAQGYFLVSGHHNLVTGCLVTHLRHFSLQADTCAYNVVYDNMLRQELSFHVRDYGKNLIAENSIILPGVNDPIEISGKYSQLGYPEYYDYPMPDGKTNVFSLDGIPGAYYSIMGPWSIQHDKSAYPNIIHNNYIMEYNHYTQDYQDKADKSQDKPSTRYGEVLGYETAEIYAPWSTKDVVYTGPYYIKPSDPWINFPANKPEFPQPSGGTFYPIVLDGSISPSTPQEIILPNEIQIYPNASEKIEPIILPELNKMKIVWSVDKMSVATVDQNGVVTGVAEGVTTLNAVSADGKVSASTQIIVNYKPIDLRVEERFVETFKSLPLNPTTGNNATIRDYYWIAPNGISWNVSGNGNRQMMLHQKNGEIYTDYLATGINSFSADFIKFAADASGTIELSIQIIAENGEILYETSSGLVDAKSTETLSADGLNINQPVRIRLYDENPNSKTKLMIQRFEWTSFAQGETAINAMDMQAPDTLNIADPSADVFDIPFTFTPANAGMSNVTYKSSNPSVVSVTIDGLVAKKEGIAIITATNVQNKAIVTQTIVVVGEGISSDNSNDKLIGTNWFEDFSQKDNYTNIRYTGELNWELLGSTEFNNSAKGLQVNVNPYGTMSALYPEEKGDLKHMVFNVRARWFGYPTFAPILTFKNPETGDVIKTLQVEEVNLSNSSFKKIEVKDLNVESPFIIEISNANTAEGIAAKEPPHIFIVKDIEFIAPAPTEYFEPAIKESDLQLKVGEAALLSTRDFDLTSPNELVWESSNSAIASVSSIGGIKALSVGSTTISATGLDYNGVTKTSSITLNVVENSAKPFYPAFITIDSISDLQSSQIGKNVTLTVGASVTAGKSLSYQWYSADDRAKSNPVIIEGATTSSYTFTKPAQGSYYHFCVISAENAIEKQTAAMEAIFTGTSISTPAPTSPPVVTAKPVMTTKPTTIPTASGTPVPSATVEPNATPAPTETLEPEKSPKPTTAPEQEETPQTKPSSNVGITLVIIIGGLIVMASAAIWFIRKK